jgi:hypothetical protein
MDTEKNGLGIKLFENLFQMVGCLMNFFRLNVFFIKQYFSCFVIVLLFTFGTFGNVYALKDKATEQVYSVSGGDGNYRFNSSMPALNPMIYLGLAEDTDLGKVFNGDMTIELTNPLCLAYIALFFVAMYAGNPAVQGIAVLALVAVVSFIYSIAVSKYDSYEMCGADWYVWGTSNTTGDVGNIKTHYPTLGPYKGSWAWIAKKCVKDLNSCLEDCASKKECSNTKSCLESDDACYIDTEFVKRDYLDMRDKLYREFIYNGRELPSENCDDPRVEAKGYDVNRDGSFKQLYYFRGTDPANYACDRFLVDEIDSNWFTSNGVSNSDIYNEGHPYGCCLKESKRICINQKDVSNDNFFTKMSNTVASAFGGSAFKQKTNYCDTDSNFCVVEGGIILEVKKGSNSNDKYCINTWSLCPYNFNIQKGTEAVLDFKLSEDLKTDSKGNYIIEDECYDDVEKKSLSCKGRPKNFYQLDRHCTYLSPYKDSPEEVQTYSPYFDKACINMVGSSHNTEGYASYRGYGKALTKYSSSFSAPFVECLTETMKNFLYNRAGHTRCADTSKFPSSEEVCDGEILYQKGEDFYKTGAFDSPISRLLTYIRRLIMISVGIMVMLFGWQILLKGGSLETKEFYFLLLKIAIVLSFTFDEWWSKQLFNLVFSATDTFSTMASKISLDTTVSLGGDLVKDDGCYFGNVRDLIGSNVENVVGKLPENNYYEYPGDKRYVQFFDTLDCKVQKYLRISMFGSTPKILGMVAAAFIWPFNIGLYILVGSLIFMLFIINFIIKAVYMFVTCAIGMTLLMYISPMIIPCILFKKTKGMFDKWLSTLMTFILQPFMLFAYISMSIAIIDKYTLGDAIYVGRGRGKQLMCGHACLIRKTSDVLNENGTFDTSSIIIDYLADRSNNNKINQLSATCRSYEGDTEVIDLKRNSVLCFIDEYSISNNGFLNSIGIFIPSLFDVELGDLIALIRVAFLLLILNSALGTVPTVIKVIIGSAGIHDTGLQSDPFHVAKKIFDYAKTIKRGTAQIFRAIRDRNQKDKDDNEEAGKTVKRTDGTGGPGGEPTPTNDTPEDDNDGGGSSQISSGDEDSQKAKPLSGEGSTSIGGGGGSTTIE